MALVMRPVLLEALTPVAMALQRMEAANQQQLQGQTGVLVRQHAMEVELLMEVLNSLQANPTQEIAQQLGLPPLQI